MRRFEVIQGERVGSSPCGELTYDAGSGQFEFAAADGAGACDVPAMFAPFVAQGTHVPGHWVNAWVQERIAPPSRQNIGQILREHGLDAYDPCALLMAHGGRSTQDGFYLREIEPEARYADGVGKALAQARARGPLAERARPAERIEASRDQQDRARPGKPDAKDAWSLSGWAEHAARNHVRERFEGLTILAPLGACAYRCVGAVRQSVVRGDRVPPYTVRLCR